MWMTKKDKKERSESREWTKSTFELVVRLDERMKAVEDRKCPHDEIIHEMKEYNKKQNGHISTISIQGLQTQQKLDMLLNMKRGRWDMVKGIGMLIITLSALTVMTLAIMGVFNPKTATSAENKCPFTECKSKEDVLKAVKVFNDYTVSRQMGFTFECNNPESENPILECYTHRTQNDCLARKHPFKFLSRAMAMDWFNYTKNKQVQIYDNRKTLIYYIDRDGKFHTVLDGVI